MSEIDGQLVFEMGYNKGFKDGIKGSIPKSVLEDIKSEIEKDSLSDVNGSKFIFVKRVNEIINKHISGKETNGNDI